MQKSKIICCFIILIAICFMISSYVYATNAVQTIVDPIKNPDYWKPNEETNQRAIDIGNTIIGAIRIIGSVIAVVVLMFIGLQYMIGSVEQKAQYKEKMLPYIIGMVLLFATTNLVGMIYNLATTENTGLPSNVSQNYGTCSCGQKLVRQNEKIFCPTVGPNGNGSQGHSW